MAASFLVGNVMGDRFDYVICQTLTCLHFLFEYNLVFVIIGRFMYELTSN